MSIAKNKLAQDILRSLTQDKNDLTLMRQMLRDERQSLEQRDHQQLEALTQQKMTLTTTIENRSKQREQWLENVGIDAGPESWRTTIARLGEQTQLPLTGLWEEVEALLVQCNELLQVNEKVIGHMKNTVDQFLSALRGASNTSQTYAPSGKLSSYSENQSITNA